MSCRRVPGRPSHEKIQNTAVRVYVVVLSSTLEKELLAGVDCTCARRLPSLHKLPFVFFPSQKKSQLNYATTAVSVFDFEHLTGAPRKASI